jgi:DMSO/TMAO reductase YedYZ molybdopterin-dependent catalytic subunit
MRQGFDLVNCRRCREKSMLEQRRIVTATPENSETPIEGVRSWVTPNRLFFVRNHFDVPGADLETWRLPVEGCVERPMTWSWDELSELPERSVFATVECAGNGRSFLQPAVHGVQWGAGAIGHAEWTGVPLRLLLHRAGIKPEATEVLFEGADRGTEADHPEPMAFARSLPLEKALDPDTLLATRMNGEPLEPIHGFPVRLLVPGWYGVASVKWLRRIEVLREPFQGYFQTTKYTIQRPGPSGLERVIVGPMALKSEIIRPHPGESLGVGTNRLFGVAWAGADALARVEVSTDGGRLWNDADLIGPRAPYSWSMWEYLWEVAEPGPYTLLARSISSSGEAQPTEHNSLLGGYLIHHSRPTEVLVLKTRHIRDERADAETLIYDMNAYAEANTRFPLDVELEFTGGEGI